MFSTNLKRLAFSLALPAVSLSTLAALSDGVSNARTPRTDLLAQGSPSRVTDQKDQFRQEKKEEKIEAQEARVQCTIAYGQKKKCDILDDFFTPEEESKLTFSDEPKNQK